MRTGLGITVLLCLALAGEAVALERCEPVQATFDRMIGLDTPPPAELIADTFILQSALARKPEALTRFWVDKGAERGNLTDLIAGWAADATERAEVARQGSLLETLRAVRDLVVAFEAPAPSAQEAADRLSARLPPHFTAIMSREAYRAEFVKQAGSVRAQGVPDYAAVLMAAQIMRNHLDRAMGVSVVRPPDDPHEMQLWDQSIRQEPLRPDIDRIVALPEGRALVNDFLIDRRTVIGCAAVAMAASRPSPSSPVQDRVPGFLTVGYSNPALLDAIYQGQTKQIDLGAVGHYLTAFVGMFVRSDIPECSNVINIATATRIAAAGSTDVLRQMFDGLREAHRGGGSRDDAFAQGFGAGATTFGGMALSEAGAEADAQLFYNQYGCDTLVARRFFDQVTDFAWQD